ncbi:MAG: CotH kinase family protein [Lysinibacillus sp.]
MVVRKIETSQIRLDYKEQLFIKDKVDVIEITVSDKNWNEILDDPTAEEYVEASVTVNGAAYNNIGIRAKGNSSLSSVADSDSERYSLKLDFAQYDSNQTYYGLEKVNLNNNFSDSTQMKEFVSYELMEQLSIATPAHSYVKVMVNGEYYGLMLAVEEIGEAFAKTNYGSTEGFIFKPEDAGSDLSYVSDDVDDYKGVFAGVKMNNKTAENNSNIISMMKEISEGDISSLDIDGIARYFALNTALVNMDSYQGSFKHNYYLYENSEGIFSILPWDYNMSFGGFSGGGGGGARPEGEGNTQDDFKPNAQPDFKPDAQSTDGIQQAPIMDNRPGMNGQQGGGIMTGQRIITDSNINFSITEPVSGTTIDARPLLKIILEDEEARALYDGYLEQIATELLTEENVQKITTPLGELLTDAVDGDPTKFTTTEQFLAGIEGDESLAAFAKQRSESIIKQLAGEIEGISAAGSSGMSGMNGGQGAGMPPQMNDGKQTPGTLLEKNGENLDVENRPALNGEQLQGMGNPHQMNGEMQDTNGMPPGMNNGAQASSSTPYKQTIILVASALLVCLIAIFAVIFISKRKYKRR